VPQIEVSFDIDANGIVHVSAKDLGTGKEQKIRIESSSGLSEDEINKMVKEAETHAEEDKRARETAETRNEADNLIYSTEKSLSDFGDKISEEERSEITDGIQALRSALEDGDLAEIKGKMEELKQASHKLAEEVYKNAQGEQQDAAGGAEQADSGGGSQESAESDSDNVEDVDYEVVDEDEKKE
jgi:molecular chaperone DnaK